jgi:hypothetical protein
MNKYGTRLSILTVAFSLMFLIVSSGIEAETNDGPKKDLVSELRIESAIPLDPTSYSVDKKILENDPIRGFLIPVKDGINVFIDYASPVHQDGIGSRDAHRNYGAIIRFHFTLR